MKITLRRHLISTGKKRQNSWLTTENELARLKKSHLKKESSPTIGNKTREKMYGNQT